MHDTQEMQQVVFIIGPGHCGSSLLELILGSHSQALALGEFKAFVEKIENGVLSQDICKVCGTGCDFWNGSASLPILQSYFRWGATNGRLQTKLYNRLGGLQRNIYRHLFQWSGAQLLIDSSKDPYWVRRQLLPFWFWRNMTPFLIYIHRDGRAVVNAYLRKYPERGIAHSARAWVAETMLFERYFRAFSATRRMQIAYEELATKPLSTMQSLCRALRMPFEQEMLQYWKHQHHVINGNAGTRSLIFKYREQSGQNMQDRWRQVEADKRGIGQDFYAQLDLGIQLDLRWQQELSPEQVATFETVAGEVNARYAYLSEPSRGQG
jgi:hypothetical protein